MSKIDLYHDEKRYNSWKAIATTEGYTEGELTKKTSDILLKYIFDMETGSNISLSSKKGCRSFSRLNSIRTRMKQLFMMFQERGVSDVTKITEKELLDFFSDMRQGKMKTQHGEKYKSVQDYVKTLKSFWHWYMKISKKNGKIIDDVTQDIDSSKEEKPKWVYLSEEQMKLLFEKCSPKYKPLLTFLYDSGARVTEALSVEVKDIHIEKGVVFVDLKDENSKTFGRKIKLLLCGKDLQEYIKRSEFRPTDRLFPFSHIYLNRYLGELAGDLFGDELSKAGGRYTEMSLYDFRHNSCCYWIQRYKNNTGLMFRFGWKTEQYILYYSEFLGMRDLISAEDLYIDVTKTELEKQLDEQRKEFKRAEEEKKELQNKVGDMESQMKKVLTLVHEMQNNSAKLKPARK
jgi:site-specific recombinase XerD